MSSKTTDFFCFWNLVKPCFVCERCTIGFLGCMKVVQLTTNGRTLSFSFCLDSGVARAWEKAHFGKSSNRVWLDEVRCTGNELTLEQCPKSAWGEHNCLHSEDAGVSCSPLSGSASSACLSPSSPLHVESSSLAASVVFIFYSIQFSSIQFKFK